MNIKLSVPLQNNEKKKSPERQHHDTAYKQLSKASFKKHPNNNDSVRLVPISPSGISSYSLRTPGNMISLKIVWEVINRTPSPFTQTNGDRDLEGS